MGVNKLRTGSEYNARQSSNPSLKYIELTPLPPFPTAARTEMGGGSLSWNRSLLPACPEMGLLSIPGLGAPGLSAQNDVITPRGMLLGSGVPPGGRFLSASFSRSWRCRFLGADAVR